MEKVIEYFLTPVSPYVYLGHNRLRKIAADAGAKIELHVVDLGAVFAISGGLPLKQRAPQRQAYRLLELARWADYLKMPLVLEPKNFPLPQDLSSKVAIALQLSVGQTAALDFIGNAAQALWAREENISEPAVIEALLRQQGRNAEAIMSFAQGEEVAAAYAKSTEYAKECHVFGAPSFRIDGELYWGQDRLEFVERALAK